MAIVEAAVRTCLPISIASTYGKTTRNEVDCGFHRCLSPLVLPARRTESFWNKYQVWLNLHTELFV